MKRMALILVLITLLTGGCASTGGSGRDNGSKVELALAAKVILEDEESDDRKMPKIIEGHAALAALVNAVAVSQDGRYAASGLSDYNIMLWDISSGNCLHILKGHKGSVISLAFSHDNSRLASGSADGAVIIWNVLTGKEILSHKTNSDPIIALAFGQDDKTMITGNNGQEITITGISGGAMNEVIKTGDSSGTVKREITPYAFSGDGRYALAANEQNTLSLWDMTTRRELRAFSGDFGTITALAFSGDGRHGLVGNSRGNVILIDINAGKELRVFEGHSGLVRSVAFSKDGRNAFSGSHDDTIKMWDVATGKETRAFSGHVNDVKSIAISPDGFLLLSGSSDSTTRAWNVKTGQEIVSMVKFIKYLPPMYMKADVAAKEDEFKELKDAWVILAPDGYYVGSAAALGNMRVTKGAWFYKIDQFYDVFYRPDIITARLHGEDTASLVSLTMEDALKNPPPDIDISSVPKSSDEEVIKIAYEVSSSGGGIGEIRIFHNGKLIQSDGYYRETKKPTADKIALSSYGADIIREEMRGLVVVAKREGKASMIDAPTKGEVFKGVVTINAIPGENEVSIAAFNKDNTVQSMLKTVTFTSTIKPEAPHIYVLSIGIDEYKSSKDNLKFAVKDAESIALMIRQESLTQYKEDKVHVTMLKNNKATKNNIMREISQLSAIVKPNDVFVLFIAGHGVLHGGLYSIVTHDFDGNLAKDSLISSNEVMEFSKRMKSLTQIFILDTCHAGGLDNFVSGLYDARMSVLARNMGLHMFASASSTQKALDGFQGKNGMFTYALLEGLNNNRNADANRDGKISIYELGGYAKTETIKNSSETGYIQTPVINNFGKDVSIYILR